MTENIVLVLLILSILILLWIFFSIRKVRKNNQIEKFFYPIIYLALWWEILEVIQIVLNKFLINIRKYDIYFESLASIGKCFIPVFIFFIGLIFNKSKIKFKRRYYLLFLIPTLTIILMLTNEIHHLVYKTYSIYTYESELGSYAIIHQIYSYGMMIAGMILLLYSSIKNTGFFSKQSIFIVIGTIIPLIVNILETYGIVKLTVYSTPISFSLAIVIYALAIFKFKFMSTAPIALQRVVDRISDSYIVLNDDMIITDFNETFIDTFKLVDVEENIRGNKIYEFVKQFELTEINNALNNIKETKEFYDIEIFVNKVEKYFNVELTVINNKEQFLGIIILFKDITQHKKDMQELEEKQEIIAKQAQLVSIGELAGGVAHDINTPISAIRTGITMLKASNPERPESEMQIIETMDNCSNKILNIVNSMRNQIRNLGGNTETVFKISSVINDIKCITYHEVKKYKAEVEVNIEDDLSIKGDPAKLGQVLTNIVMNAAQAYKNTDGGKIRIVLMRGPQNMAITKIIDFAGGIDDSIKNNIFKSMLTTKGIEGTGLGLYLAYSVIKGNFNGDINFDTEKGLGTTFYISIPIYREEKEND